MTSAVIEKSSGINSLQKGKYLIFTLGREEYGIEIGHISEIIGGVQEITHIPHLPEYVKGVINLRGKIIPVIDVRMRFRKESREYDDRTCIVVVEVVQGLVGMIVDRVIEVASISRGDISSPPQVNQGFQKYVSGVGKVDGEVKLLLDCEAVLEDEELGDISDIQEVATYVE